MKIYLNPFFCFAISFLQYWRSVAKNSVGTLYFEEKKVMRATILRLIINLLLQIMESYIFNCNYYIDDNKYKSLTKNLHYTCMNVNFWLSGFRRMTTNNNTCNYSLKIWEICHRITWTSQRTMNTDCPPKNYNRTSSINNFQKNCELI